VSELVQRVEKSILERRLFRRGQAILVAVSGGLDSMVLLELLGELSRKHDWRLTVAHFNHRLRGRSSDADERLVARTANKLGWKFISDSADVRKYASEQKLSVEMAARALRHGFLARAASRLKIRTVALAHHADDQVELFFLRLLRGAGGEGLAGMKWQNPSPSDPRILLARPLLDQSKTDLQSFAKEHRVRFREDATNAQLDFQRNRVRHELLPLLEARYQPALSRVILRQMDILGAEADCVTQMAREWIKTRGAFETLPVAVQRRCLQIQVAEQGVMPHFDLVEALRQTPNRPFTVNNSLAVSREKSGILHVRAIAKPTSNRNETTVFFRGGAGVLAFDNVEITWKMLPIKRGIVRARRSIPDCEFFDADKVGSPVVLRHWQPGDRFQPIGMTSACKLQDLFTNQKILRTRRHQLIVGATVSGELFWVEGLRLAERFKLDKKTRRQLKWVWKRL
jgi:tRNA(Ile)-lysidine synthase